MNESASIQTLLKELQARLGSPRLGLVVKKEPPKAESSHPIPSNQALRAILHEGSDRDTIHLDQIVPVSETGERQEHFLGPIGCWGRVSRIGIPKGLEAVSSPSHRPRLSQLPFFAVCTILANVLVGNGINGLVINVYCGSVQKHANIRAPHPDVSFHIHQRPMKRDGGLTPSFLRPY